MILYRNCPTPQKASWADDATAHGASLLVPGTKAYRCQCGLWHLRNAEARTKARTRSKKAQLKRKKARERGEPT